MLSVFSQFIFGKLNVFGNQSGGIKVSLWRDKSLCFDSRPSDLELTDGEQLIACFYPIEDVKGNPNELGLLEVTNLRLIWICCSKKRVNLSIGWRTVSLTFEQSLKDLLGGSRTSLCVLSKYESTKYEFVFKKMQTFERGAWTEARDENCPEASNNLMELGKFLKEKRLPITHLTPSYLEEPFGVVFKVWQLYRQTQLFRMCRANLSGLLELGGPEKQRSEFKRLPSEQIIEVHEGIAQVESRSVQHMGRLTLTSVRLVWLDGSLPLRNLSVPYIRIRSVRARRADRLVISTHDYLVSSTQVELAAGAKSRALCERLQSLAAGGRARPRFGPESCEECASLMADLRPVERYLEATDDPFMRALDALAGERHPGELAPELVAGDSERLEGRRRRQEESVERSERELASYSAQLGCQLDERPLGRDAELVHSAELGLAVERPAGGLEVGRVWRLEL